MSNMNKNLEEFSIAIRDFCQDCADDEAPALSAKHLCALARRHIPDLMSEIPDAPDIILARRLIEFALKGLDNFALSTIWKLYYLRQEPLKSVALSVGRSIKTIQRQLSVFHEKISIQLWDKSYEYAHPIADQQPMTENQRMKKFIQQKYYLTPMQANVLLEFWLGGNAGRNQICNDLYISYSTLKCHIKKILHRVGATNMNDAVRLTHTAYEKHLGAPGIDNVVLLPPALSQTTGTETLDMNAD